MKVCIGQVRVNRKNGKVYEVISKVDDWFFRIQYIGNKVETVWYVGKIHRDPIWVYEKSHPKTFNELLNNIWC